MLKILIVEDDRELRQLFSHVLTRQGYSVIGASDGIEALKIIDGDYKDAIDICKVIAEVRTFMPQEIKEKMSKPQPEMYSKMMKQEIEGIK